MTTITPASRVAAALAARGVTFAAQITQAAGRNGLDPRLLAAVAAQETGGPGANGGRNVVGDGGHGHGLFQIDDRYHAFASTPTAMDPGKNADYAAGMISGLLRHYGGDVRKALSAYNAGSPTSSGTITQWQDGSRLGYADSVLRHYGALGAAAPSTVDDLRAESSAEQANVNALSAFAGSFPSMPSPSPGPAQSYSYRQLAGLDDDGRSTQSDSAASVVDPESDDGA